MAIGDRTLTLAAFVAAAIMVVVQTVATAPAWWPWQRPVRPGLAP